MVQCGVALFRQKDLLNLNTRSQLWYFHKYIYIHSYSEDMSVVLVSVSGHEYQKKKHLCRQDMGMCWRTLTMHVCKPGTNTPARHIHSLQTLSKSTGTHTKALSFAVAWNGWYILKYQR